MYAKLQKSSQEIFVQKFTFSRNIKASGEIVENIWHLVEQILLYFFSLRVCDLLLLEPCQLVSISWGWLGSVCLY